MTQQDIILLTKFLAWFRENIERFYEMDDSEIVAEFWKECA